jgi:hypothetical protein
MKWIDITEAQPNIRFEVIVCDKYGMTQAGYYVLDENTQEYNFETLIVGDIIKDVRYWTNVPRLSNDIITALNL